MKKDLALFGGEKIIKNKLKKYNTIGPEESDAVKEVLDSGCLSKFLGCCDDDFYGGPKVREFEKNCSDFFNVKHVVTVNSWTSGLICAIGAIGIEPGDEVIVTPWTMCATATAILHWNAIPVFCDIEEDTFNLNPLEIEKKITKKTKAILAADIFGHSCDVRELMKIANKYKIKLITDSAQSPGAINSGHYVGTESHVGGYSLNYHKHIHTGEGGILVTNDFKICEKMQLIRNHGEAVVSARKINNISNIIGHNFRLGEIECAIGIEQLKKLKKFVNTRQKLAKEMNRGLKNLAGLILPKVLRANSHSYYVYGMKLDLNVIKIKRERIIMALEAEGLTGLTNGYANIHLLPIFQRKIAYGSKGFPWTSDICENDVSYLKGICPVAEELHEKSFIGFEMCLHELPFNEINLVIECFQKVWSNLEFL